MPFGWGRKEAGALDVGLLDAFDAALSPDPGAAGPAVGWTARDTKALTGREIPLFTVFMAERARTSVGAGLLRFLLPASSPSIEGWNGQGGWHSDWPSFPGGAAFASDWLGRVYLFADGKPKGDEPRVARFDPATAEREVFDATFGEFVGDAMPRLWRDLLSVDILDAWRGAGGAMPAVDACVCHKIPLVLGGSDDVSNLEISPLVVWVSLSGQIHEQVKDLPPGTPISGVSLRPPK